MPSVTSASFAERLASPVRWISAMRAMIPPSPSLSARMMNVTYLSETMIVTDQNTSEITP
jgi:hypothetical protein